MWPEPAAHDAAGEAGENAEEEFLQRLESSIETLESSERELLRLDYFEAVPHREIAHQICNPLCSILHLHRRQFIGRGRKLAAAGD